MPAMARLPSGVNTTWATCSPMATVSTSLTCLPWIDSTPAGSSCRPGLAISARLPARLIDMPEGCLPTATVSISAGGLVVEIDDVELVVGHGLPVGPVGHPVHRVGHQRELAVGRDAQVGWRTEDRVHQGQTGDDPRIGRVGADVDDRHRVLAGRQQLQLAVLAPGGLVVDADHHEFGLALRHGIGARTGREACHGHDQRGRDDSIHSGLHLMDGLLGCSRAGGDQYKRWHRSARPYRAYPSVSISGQVSGQVSGRVPVDRSCPRSAFAHPESTGLQSRHANGAGGVRHSRMLQSVQVVPVRGGIVNAVQFLR